VTSTMKDVAKRAGVSISTVSHVLNNTRFVSEALRSKVEHAIEGLAYQPNPLGRGLRKGKSFTIALVLPDHGNPFFVQAARGAQELVRQQNYSLITCNTDEELDQEAFYISSLLQRKVDGFIIAPTQGGSGNLQPLVETQTPFVVIDRYVDGIPADQVVSDNRTGGYQATEHLIQLGHKRIGLLVGIPLLTPIIDRTEGYRQALQANGMEVDENLLSEGCSQIEEGYLAMESLLAINGLTAVFSTNNMMSLGVLRCLKDKRIRCPEEISLVGFDDAEWATSISPSLTVVAQQPYEMGFIAAELLFAAIESKNDKAKPRTIRLETSLISRESTAKPLNSGR